MKKYILFIILFIVVIGGFVGFWQYRERIFSKEILKLEILSQEKAKLLEDVEYTIKYKNNGNFALLNPQLIFELPENSLTEDSKIRFIENLPDIYPGAENFIKFKGRLLGKEGDLKVAKAWLSYTPKNLTARYESDTTFTTQINFVDLNLDFDLISKIEKGKDVEYSLNYYSNIDYPLENLSIKIDPIDDFIIKYSDPLSLDKLEWRIPNLTKAQGGKIKISGYTTIDLGKKLNFKAMLGTWIDGNFIVLKEANTDLQVIEPKIFISQLINGSSNYIATPGEFLKYEIFFRNIGYTPFENLFALVRLNSNAFDISSASALGGDVRVFENSIVFDYRQNSQLEKLNSQQEGKLEFNIKLKDNWQVGDSEKNNLTIKNTVQISEISQEFITKVNSKIEILQKAFYSNQAGIENYGPIPSISNEVTTYIISWQIKNDSGDIKNVKVKATLPQGILLTGFVSPESEYSKFSFDNKSRELIWFVGDIKAGESPSPLYFQISFTPQDYQKGNIATLVNSATIYGENEFTGSVVQNTSSEVDTNLKYDLENSGKGIIQ